MDDLCLSIRTYRQCNSSGNVEQWINDLTEMLETTEESVINQLSEILLEELEKGLTKDKIGTVIRTTKDAVGTAPLARKDHFVYGILDLIQQHIQTLDSGKINEKIVRLSLHVAEISPYSFLRCKAFEVLAAMSSKPGVGQMPIQLVSSLFEKNAFKEDADKVGAQWRTMRKRAVDVEYFFMELRGKSPNVTPLTAAALEVQPLQN
jgi:hypothetical protein